MNDWKIGQEAFVELDDDIALPQGWYKVTITNLTQDGWCETRSSQGGWSGEMFPLSCLRERPSNDAQHRNSVGRCHYCGGPAYGFGFFDEPACKECGGK